MFSVMVTSPKGDASEIACPAESCSIGKADDNNVVLRGWSIAKKHAIIMARGNGLYIVDQQTMMGTEINGDRNDDFGPLADTDKIVIGGYELHVIGASAFGNGKAAAAPVAAKSAAALPQTTPAPAAQTPAIRSAPMTPQAMPAAVAPSRTPAALPATPAVAQAAALPPAVSAAPVAVAPETAKPAAPPAMPPTEAAVADDNEPMRKVAVGLHVKLLAAMDLRRMDVGNMDDADLRLRTQALVEELVGAEPNLPSGIDRAHLVKHLVDEAVGLGPLESLLADDLVTEIMVNRYDEIFIERGGKLTKSSVNFSSHQAVQQAIERIVAPLGRRIDESSPMVDGRLKDGSRVNAVIPPLALKGPNITIRKFSKNKLTHENLERYNSIKRPMSMFLKLAVEQRSNVIISGGTGSGKTTLLNVLSNFIPDDQRIVTVEDAAELRLSQPNLIGLEARPANSEGKGAISIRELVKNCLRMRPDRIVVGECRGGEALDMLQAMNTGHDGSLTTAHANSPRDCLSRIETMVLMAGLDLPIQAIREQITSAVHLIVQQTRFACGSRKVTYVTEITGMESGIIQLQDIFLFKMDGYGADGKVSGTFIATGAIPDIAHELQQRGIPVDLSVFQKGVMAA